MSKFTKILLAFVVLLIGTLLLYFLFVPQAQNPAVVFPPNSARNLLTDKSHNPSFQNGLSLAKSGRPNEAVAEYKNALSQAQSPEEESYILYLSARATEDIDIFESIKQYKQIAANTAYPSNQRAYAVIRLPLLLSKTSDPKVKEAILEGEPYNTFASDDGLTLYKNFYDYSLTLGSTGLAEFSVVRSEAKRILNSDLSESERALTLERIENLLANGEKYIIENRTDVINADFMPLVMRERARSYGALAQIDYKNAKEVYKSYFDEAITANILLKGDGAVRFDYFVYGFLNEGVSSFTQTQPHLMILLNNIHEYPAMKVYFENEKNNLYNVKDLFVEIANTNNQFKDYLINEAGWQDADFER